MASIPAAPKPTGSGGAAADGETWAGSRLGLPESGPRSIARLGRRIAALFIDWALASLISWAFFSYNGGATLVIFAIEQAVFVAFANGSIGHLILGLRVVPITGGWIGIWRPAVRALLLLLVIPALIWDRDLRGLHDKIAGTVLVRKALPARK